MSYRGRRRLSRRAARRSASGSSFGMLSPSTRGERSFEIVEGDPVKSGKIPLDPVKQGLQRPPD